MPPATMPATVVKFAIGERVKMIRSPGLYGKVIEHSGRYGPNKSMVYRVWLECKTRRPVRIEIQEDHLEST